MPTPTHSSLEKLFTAMIAAPAPKTVTQGDPQTFYADLVDDDAMNVGVWSSTVGAWEINGWSVNEFMLIQSGRVRITTAGGTVELKAGDVYYAPKGLVATWETVEDVKKLYVIVG